MESFLEFYPNCRKLTITSCSDQWYMCHLCKLHFGTTSHCLFFCDATRNIWKQTIYWQSLRSLRVVSFIEYGMYIMKLHSKEEFEIFAMIFWAIWQEICMKVHDQSQQVKEFNIDWVYSFMDAFRNASSRGELICPELRSIIDMAWRSPNPGHLRIDVDASFDTLNDKFSVGVVVRDSHGLVRGVKTSVIRNPGSVKGAELEAILFGMDFCLRQGFTNVCIFSDSTQAVQALTYYSEDIGPESVLALEIRSLLASPEFVSITSMRRTANRVVRQLAKEAFKSTCSLEWLNG